MTALDERLELSGKRFRGATTWKDKQLCVALLGIDDGTLRVPTDYLGDLAAWSSVLDKILGIGWNGARILLDHYAFVNADQTFNQAKLDQLAALLALCEQKGVYVQLTGLLSQRAADQWAWYNGAGEATRWNLQAAWWGQIAAACSTSRAVFSYDLINEPVLPSESTLAADLTPAATTMVLADATSFSASGGEGVLAGKYNVKWSSKSGNTLTLAADTPSRSDTVTAGTYTYVTDAPSTWTTGAFYGLAFANYLTRTRDGRTNAQIETAWAAKMAAAVRAQDPRPAITIGALRGDSQDWRPSLDLLTAHAYGDTLGHSGFQSALDTFSTLHDTFGYPASNGEFAALATIAPDLNLFMANLRRRIVAVWGHFPGWTAAEIDAGQAPGGASYDGYGLMRLFERDFFTRSKKFWQPEYPKRRAAVTADVINAYWLGIGNVNSAGEAQTLSGYASPRAALMWNMIDEAQTPATDHYMSGVYADSYFEVRVAGPELPVGGSVDGATVWYYAGTPQERVALLPDAMQSGKDQWTKTGAAATTWQTLKDGISSGGQLDSVTPDTSKYMSTSGTDKHCQATVADYTIPSGRSVTGARIRAYLSTGAGAPMTVALYNIGGSQYQSWTVPAGTAAGWQTFTYTGALTQTQVNALGVDLYAPSSNTGTMTVWRAWVEVILNDASTTLLTASARVGSTEKATQSVGTAQADAWRSFSISGALTQSDLDDLRLRFTVPSVALMTLRDAANVRAAFVEWSVSEPQRIAP